MMRPIFADLVHEILPGCQAQIFTHWLKTALHQLYDGKIGSGQAMVLCGPPCSGKSFLQSIVTSALGGACFNPFGNWTNERFSFSLECATTRHWKIDDVDGSDFRTRTRFGQKLKEALLEKGVRYERKGQDAILLPLFRRITISMGEAPENLQCLPPLDGMWKEKIFLLKSERSKALNSTTGMYALSEGISLRRWLIDGVDAVDVPLGFDSQIYGIKAWQNPELADRLIAAHKARKAKGDKSW